MKIKWIAATLIFSAIHLFAVESSLTPDQLKTIEFKQNLNAEIPFDAVFYEEGKGEFSFGELMGEKPALLILGYDNCPMLCGLLFNGVFSTLQEVRLNAGKDFSVISVSIDPDENPKMTAARKTMYIKRYGRRAAKNGWAFLTGEKREIDRLAEAVGFGYLYDPELEEYAHPSGFVILTPNGRISRYFFGIDFNAKEVNQAIREASGEKVGSPIHQFILTCFQFNPLTGKYGPVIMKAIRVGGVLSLLFLGAYLGRAFYRENKKSKLPAETNDGGGP